MPERSGLGPPDPLFDDADDQGASVRFSSTYRSSDRYSNGRIIGGYYWRKAQGSTCAKCSTLIEGRRYEVRAWNQDDAWHCVKCFDFHSCNRQRYDLAQKAKPSPASPGTKAWLKKVEKAMKVPTFQCSLNPQFIIKHYSEATQ